MIETRCTEGILTVSEMGIEVRLPHLGNRAASIRSTSIARAAYTGMSRSMAVPSFFGKGGASNLTFYSQSGMTIVAHMVKKADADRVQAFLGG